MFCKTVRQCTPLRAHLCGSPILAPLATSRTIRCETSVWTRFAAHLRVTRGLALRVRARVLSSRLPHVHPPIRARAELSASWAHALWICGPRLWGAARWTTGSSSRAASKIRETEKPESNSLGTYLYLGETQLTEITNARVNASECQICSKRMVCSTVGYECSPQMSMVGRNQAATCLLMVLNLRIPIVTSLPPPHLDLPSMPF